MFTKFLSLSKNGLLLPDNGIPDSAQLRKINAMQPRGFEPLIADELFVVNGLVADNLITRNFAKWSRKSLDQMSKLIVSVPTTLDHDWDSVKKVWGRTFEASIITIPPGEVPDEYLDKAGNYEFNKKIVQDEGLVCCIASAFTSIDDEVLGRLRYIQVNEISTGGFSFTDFVCPECNVSFGTNQCRHYPPNSYIGRNADDPQEVPYYIRHNLIDIMEWSFVTLPNLPGAGAV